MNLKGRIPFIMLMLLLIPMTAMTAFAQYQPVVASPNSTIAGGQLIFYYDLIKNDFGYMTITNLGQQDTQLHIVLYSDECEHSIDFFVTIERYCSLRFNLTATFNTNTDSEIGLMLKDTRGLIVATPVDSNRPDASRLYPYAIAYNHLTGSITMANTDSKAAFAFNAVARFALHQTVTPASVSTYSLAADNAVLNGPNNGATPGDYYFFQRIAPTKLLLDHFFALNTVDHSRLAFISFAEDYGSVSNNYYYEIVPPTGGTFSVFAETEDCANFSLPNLPFSCILSTDLKTDGVLGSAKGYFRLFSGVLHLTPKARLESNENLFGFFYEKLGPYGGGRPLWAEYNPPN